MRWVISIRRGEMADSTVCVQHPLTSKPFCVTVESKPVPEEEPAAKSAEAPKDSEMDACMKNEECRMMFLRLQMLNSAKTGFPGI